MSTTPLPKRISQTVEDCDPSSRLILDEAERRGIGIEVLAPRAEYFRLTRGSRSIVCRESLSELTHAVALSRCDDKRTTSRLLREAGVRTPAQQESSGRARDEAFLAQHGAIVVKPARGEQGKGISVGIRSAPALRDAIARAAEVSTPVLLEELVYGHDLRLIVIAQQLVAAAVRCPPRVTGDGQTPLRTLIERQSQLRAAKTAGASKIPLDAETERCVREAGFTLDDVPPSGKAVVVRAAANVHQGGTIHDVTAEVHPALIEVARHAANALDLPVVGLDLIVPSVSGPDYWVLEANERPGLANHEPQPTAQRFVDFLFPETAS
ncbi:MAG: GNAT-family acetyltransferase [Myxococcaceae bacterium]|nr:GNAT-family acetyltransferase [Myxococcaceae bacterium]